MKKNILLVILLYIGLFLSSCGGNTEQKETIADEKVVYGQTKVEVYYFHGDRRCATCNAIEELVKSFLAEAYNNNPDVKFFVINYDKSENAEIAEKFAVAGSSLFIASGDKKMNLTMEAFQFVSADPDYLKNEMRDIINGYLN
ncbi:MAG: nitrophenyl compound nitroreductase subunit ArsF family protein [Bacteroidales bacterium]|nr:nitrophenyl compound nitroreductase subunit ArsF family protein [Bacteroidales bacterium]